MRTLADDMFETMYEAPGIGLAAIQIAQPLRLITMDLAKKDEDGETKPSRASSSIRRSSARRRRSRSTRKAASRSPNITRRSSGRAQVRVRFTDLDGKVHEEDADGLLATCIQHEIDHLNGVLFVDYLSKLKRDRVMKKFKRPPSARGVRRRRL